MTGRAAAMLLVTGVALVGCGGDADRDRVDTYIERANGVQKRSEPALARANETYVAFSRGDIQPAEAATSLRQAELSIRAARDALAVLRPPDLARALHAKLVRLYDLTLAFAHQTTLLASYQRGAVAALTPLARHDRELQTGLRRADAAEDQIRVLNRFTQGVSRSIDRLRRQRVPLVLRPPHLDQLERLNATRRLSQDLRASVQDRDARRIARLLLRFRRTERERRPRRGLAGEAVEEYNRRYRDVQQAYADVRREHARLDRALG